MHYRNVFISLLCMSMASLGCEQKPSAADEDVEDVGVSDAGTSSTSDAASADSSAPAPDRADGTGSTAGNGVDPEESSGEEPTAGHIAEARALWAKGRRFAAIEVLESAKKDDPETLNELGYMELEVDRLVAAWEHLGQAEESTDETTPKALRARIYYNLALVAEARGDTPSAAQAVTKAYELNPVDSVGRALVRIKGAPELDCSELEAVTLVETEVEGTPGLTWQGQQSDMSPGFVSWRGDLNGDELEDLVVNHRQCGNWGDCIYVVYAGCPGGKHAVVFNDYAQSVDVLDSVTLVGARPWRKLEIGGRDTTAEPAEQFLSTTFSFGGDTYERP